jgi:plastocyanin
MEKYLSQFILRVRFLWVALSLATAVTLLLVACAGSSAGSTQARPPAQGLASATPSLTPVAVVNVKIVEKNGMYFFDPAKLSIKVGTQVVWVNDSNALHTVTSDTAVFDSGSFAQNKTYKYLFTKPDTYPYYCNLHLYMIGTIVVTS